MQKIIEISDYELERGKPMPSKIHSKIQSRVSFLLEKDYYDKFDFFSELTFSLNGYEFVPDLSIMAKTKTDYSEDEIKIFTPPLSAIEILSPTQALGDLIIKMHKLIDAGVRSYWIIVPPTKTVFMFNHKKEQTPFIAGKVVDNETGIEIEMSELFK